MVIKAVITKADTAVRTRADIIATSGHTTITPIIEGNPANSAVPVDTRIAIGKGIIMVYDHEDNSMLQILTICTAITK